MAGGGNELDNLTPACRSCNSKRGALEKARRDATRAQQRPNGFFVETTVPPTPCFRMFDSNQPEPAGTDKDHSVIRELDPDAPRLEMTGLGGNSYGPAVARWAKTHLDIELMPWQLRALSGQLEHDDAGDLIFRESLISTARQQGKSVSLVALIGWWVTEFAAHRGNPQSVLSTANKLDRAEAFFMQLAPVLVEKFGGKAINQIGRKSVSMPDGSRWEVRAASPSLHGGSHDLIVVDELWNISSTVVDDALRPSMIARKSPLLSCWSTAGDQSSECMIGMRSACLGDIDQGRRGMTYFAEWSMPPGADPRDERNWRYANPALGRTVTIEALRAVSNKDSFLRAHLNVWVTARDAWLDAGIWDDGRVDIDTPIGGVLAIDSSVDSSRYVGVRSVQIEEKVLTFVEFVTDNEVAMWDEVDRVMAGGKTQLLVTPTLEIHLPDKYRERYQLWGYAELLKYTTLVRGMILEGRVIHTGQQTLAEHVNRAVMVRTSQGAAISSQRSPGPIEACRCMIASVAAVSRPVSKAKPVLVIARG